MKVAESECGLHKPVYFVERRRFGTWRGRTRLCGIQDIECRDRSGATAQNPNVSIAANQVHSVNTPRAKSVVRGRVMYICSRIALRSWKSVLLKSVELTPYRSLTAATRICITRGV